MSDEIRSLDQLGAAVSEENSPISNEKVSEPIRDKLGRSYATGKRKNSVSRVWIKPGKGIVSINGKDLDNKIFYSEFEMI